MRGELSHTTKPFPIDLNYQLGTVLLTKVIGRVTFG